jgi:hypothetical protein
MNKQTQIRVNLKLIAYELNELQIKINNMSITQEDIIKAIDSNKEFLKNVINTLNTDEEKAKKCPCGTATYLKSGLCDDCQTDKETILN